MRGPWPDPMGSSGLRLNFILFFDKLEENIVERGIKKRPEETREKTYPLTKSLPKNMYNAYQKTP